MVPSLFFDLFRFLKCPECVDWEGVLAPGCGNTPIPYNVSLVYGRGGLSDPSAQMMKEEKIDHKDKY